MQTKLQAVLRSNEITFGYRIGYLSNVFSGPVYTVAERDFGIQRPMFATLFCIAHLDDLTATDVCAMTGIGKKTISRAVSALESRRFLKRRRHPADNRSSLLRITAAGRRTYESILPMLQARQKAMIGTLDREEQRQLRALLDKLIARDDDWSASY
jgi:DNA-binding MarR family transcriptional regulator